MRRRRAWIVVALALVLGTALAVVLQGCSEAPTIGYLCPDPKYGYDPRCTQCVDLSLPGCCAGYYNNYGTYVPEPAACPKDGGAGGGDASTSIAPGNGACSGECVPGPFTGWSSPALAWFGPVGDVPPCPADAPNAVAAWNADLTAPRASCTACTCSPSSGTCAPPLQLTTSTSPCANGAPARAFDPPPDWDGGCTGFDAIAAGDLCNGALCAGSLTAGPLVLNEDGCTPSTATLVAQVPPSWQTAALACSGTTSPGSTCDDPGLTCAPSAAQASWFRTCIYEDGDDDCPPSYPAKHLVYGSFTDARGCAPCTCGPPDSSCSAKLDVYPEGTCTPDPPLSLTLTSAGPSCTAVDPPGSALGSKALAQLGYSPGTCAPGGGGLMGDVEPSGSATFCCLS